MLQKNLENFKNIKKKDPRLLKVQNGSRKFYKVMIYYEISTEYDFDKDVLWKSSSHSVESRMKVLQDHGIDM
jgi:hypothetical protein